MEILTCIISPFQYDLTPIQIAAQLGHHADVMALFPVTTPIPGIPDWSVRGIMEYVNSAEARNKVTRHLFNLFRTSGS